MTRLATITASMATTRPTTDLVCDRVRALGAERKNGRSGQTLRGARPVHRAGVGAGLRRRAFEPTPPLDWREAFPVL
ncbi:MAG: hypothetical protein HRU01_03405 [Myxococcales bacterium]|nr:hypothetical protein [Myxococcales bacterium]